MISTSFSSRFVHLVRYIVVSLFILNNHNMIVYQLGSWGLNSKSLLLSLYLLAIDARQDATPLFVFGTTRFY